MVVTDGKMEEELGVITGSERRCREAGEGSKTGLEGVRTTERRELEVGDVADAALGALGSDDRRGQEDMIE